MADGFMNYEIDPKQAYPLVQIYLEYGERARISRGSMVYHSTGVQLNTKLNSKTGLLGALGRSMTSGESAFITEVVSSEPNGFVALAPNVPGEIVALEIGANQYRINDGAFLAMDGSRANYHMERQKLSKAFFGGQGGLFVMTTEGEGTILCNAFGSVQKIEVSGTPITIDNAHVIAWDVNLDYNIHLENGFFQSIGTGEGVVNTFHGHGTVWVQTLNLETFGAALSRYIGESSGGKSGKGALDFIGSFN
ncbi:MAG: TIGR00266 family protein [Lactobacillales bacterium]|jgi:uncharacterized protein (TIGR00266 family)|nr:TIGR00266 family protein [Lactobacillales bacterium]